MLACPFAPEDLDQPADVDSVGLGTDRRNCQIVQGSGGRQAEADGEAGAKAAREANAKLSLALSDFGSAV
jgi:hypothetical protein